MPKGARGKRDYKREIKETAKRMRKYPEGKKSAISSRAWHDFLIDIGISQQAISSGSSFWEEVRGSMPSVVRTSKYQQAREAGMPSKMAGKVRDWSQARLDREIEKWQSGG